MVDQLRLFLNRPLSEADRPRLFAIAAAVIVGAAAILALLDDTASTPPPLRPAPTSGPDASAQPSAMAPLPAATSRPPSEESRPATGTGPSKAVVAQAKRAARRFLARYLPYTYGRVTARTLAALTPELRERLAAERPRVPVAERRRRPRLELLQSDGVGREQARLTALVRDGKRRYTVHLELALTASGWQVSDLGR